MFCFQLEPDKDRCGFLTIPEEWKIVDDIMQQAQKGTHEKGTCNIQSYSSHVECSNLPIISNYCLLCNTAFSFAMAYLSIQATSCRPSDRVRFKNANYVNFLGEIVRLERPIVR